MSAINSQMAQKDQRTAKAKERADCVCLREDSSCEGFRQSSEGSKRCAVSGIRHF